MPRYILIDNLSGYVFGDSADLDGHTFTGTAIEYAAALDASIGEHHRTYATVNRCNVANSETAYHVYRADVNGSEAIPVVYDGQDRETIEAVEQDCEYIATIRCLPSSQE